MRSRTIRDATAAAASSRNAVSFWLHPGGAEERRGEERRREDRRGEENRKDKK
jgi:hypothetical protein